MPASCSAHALVTPRRADGASIIPEELNIPDSDSIIDDGSMELQDSSPVNGGDSPEFEVMEELADLDTSVTDNIQVNHAQDTSSKEQKPTPIPDDKEAEKSPPTLQHEVVRKEHILSTSSDSFIALLSSPKEERIKDKNVMLSQLHAESEVTKLEEHSISENEVSSSPEIPEYIDTLVQDMPSAPEAPGPAVLEKKSETEMQTSELTTQNITQDETCITEKQPPAADMSQDSPSDKAQQPLESSSTDTLTIQQEKIVELKIDKSECTPQATHLSEISHTLVDNTNLESAPEVSAQLEITSASIQDTSNSDNTMHLEKETPTPAENTKLEYTPETEAQIEMPISTDNTDHLEKEAAAPADISVPSSPQYKNELNQVSEPDVPTTGKISAEPDIHKEMYVELDTLEKKQSENNASAPVATPLQDNKLEQALPDSKDIPELTESANGSVKDMQETLRQDNHEVGQEPTQPTHASEISTPSYQQADVKETSSQSNTSLETTPEEIRDSKEPVLEPKVDKDSDVVAIQSDLFPSTSPLNKDQKAPLDEGKQDEVVPSDQKEEELRAQEVLPAAEDMEELEKKEEIPNIQAQESCTQIQEEKQKEECEHSVEEASADFDSDVEELAQSGSQERASEEKTEEEKTEEEKAEEDKSEEDKSEEDKTEEEKAEEDKTEEDKSQQSLNDEHEANPEEANELDEFEEDVSQVDGVDVFEESLDAPEIIGDEQLIEGDALLDEVVDDISLDGSDVDRAMEIEEHLDAEEASEVEEAEEFEGFAGELHDEGILHCVNIINEIFTRS